MQIPSTRFFPTPFLNSMRCHRQSDRTDCAAACLAYIGEHHGLRLSDAQLRRSMGTDRFGTSAAALVQTAADLGFTAKGVKGPAEALPTVPLPAIAHCLIDRRLLHYVVLVRWTPKFARVMDPAVGRVEKWTCARFLAAWTGVLVLVSPGQGFRPGDRTVPPWRRLWILFRPHRSLLVQALTGAVVTTVLGLATSVYVQKIVDAVIPDGNRQLLNLLSVAMLAILVIKLALGVFQSLLSLHAAQRIDATLILGYYRHLLRLPQPFFDTMRIGEIVSRVADAVKIRNFLNQSLLNLVLNPLILLFSLAAIFTYSPRLAALSLALLPAHAALYWATDRLNRASQRSIMQKSAEFEAQLVEALGAQMTVRLFRLETMAGLQHENRLVRLLRAAWRASVGGLAAATAAGLLASVYGVALLWYGAGLVLDASLSPGELMSCYTLSSYLSGPLSNLIGLNATAQEALIAADRLFEVMDLEMEADQGRIAFEPPHAGDIRFEHVSFQYAGRAAVLADISFTAPAGRITALVGESGSGKSTLLAMLPRLYAPTRGRIFIGAHDIRYFHLATLRRNLAVVPQQTRLLSGTVVGNLAPGEIRPDFERLLAVCRRVGILEFIEALPRGFFTVLTENGQNLSGGQRQRMALARALYLEAPIILLDEPTAALDARAEAMLLGTLRELRAEGRTILITAHHPQMVALADRMIHLAAGRIVPSTFGEARFDEQTAPAVGA